MGLRVHSYNIGLKIKCPRVVASDGVFVPHKNDARQREGKRSTYCRRGRNRKK